MVEKCDFDRQFSFDSYLFNFLSNFIKMAIFESCKTGISNCKGIISVNQMMSALSRSQSSITFVLIHSVEPCRVISTRHKKINHEAVKHTHDLSKKDVYQ